MLLSSCSKETASVATPDLPAKPYAYSTGSKDKVKVVGFSFGLVVVNTVTITPPTNFGVTLGRVLFNDNVLSAGNTIHCGSCHVSPNSQNAAGLIPLVNEPNNGDAYRKVHPNGLEQPEKLVRKMNNTPYYGKLFRDAYGSSEITTEKVSDALAQYIAAMAAASPEELDTDQRFSNPFK
jgi:cytochrome c peroxidase